MKSLQKDNKIKIDNSLRKKDLMAFCKRVEIKFQNLELLEQAFHHRSSVNEGKAAKNNERLEFLGDSVLGMVTAAYLYKNLENPEGDLAKIKSAVVSEKALAPVALNFGIDKLLIMGHGEEKSGGRQKPAILADCMEAIIGAYYLDSGYKSAEKFVLSFIIPAINEVLEDGLKDFKGKAMIKNYLKQFLTNRFIDFFLNETGIDGETQLSRVNKKSKNRLIENLKRFSFEITGFNGDLAKVTVGGIDLTNINSKI